MIELRELKSCDLFPMVQILNRIGFKELKTVLTHEKIKDMMKVFKEQGEEEQGEEQEDMSTILGFNLLFEVAGIILDNLPKCETELYRFLSGLSGLSVEQISDLSLGDFAEMVVDVLKKPEFGDFFKAVSKLFN